MNDREGLARVALRRWHRVAALVSQHCVNVQCCHAATCSEVRGVSQVSRCASVFSVLKVLVSKDNAVMW